MQQKTAHLVMKGNVIMHKDVYNYDLQYSVKSLYSEVQIKPLENLKGTLLAVCLNKYGIEYQVRYYMNGEQKTEWFLEQEIIIKGDE